VYREQPALSDWYPEQLPSRSGETIRSLRCHRTLDLAVVYTPDTELDFSSSALPGGSLIASVYDRVLMQLSDRGGSSNSVGARWAELCADALESGDGDPYGLRTAVSGSQAAQSIRLDDIPEIARTASRNKLQNPDFLMVGGDATAQRLWAADAKFSVDTARSKQVSGDLVTSLLELGDTVRSLLPNLGDHVTIENGVFLCPDYPLTHRLLRDRQGPRRTTVHRDEVRFIPVTAAQFLAPLGHEGLRQFFARIDDFPIDSSTSLMLAMYYFRLSRAGLGCWQDQTGPLLAYRETPTIDEDAIEAQARVFATIRTSAWGIVQRWNDLADEVRRQRFAVDRASSISIDGKLLRVQIEHAAAAAGVVPPSASKVRRSIGSWFRGQVRDQFGPLQPPVKHLDAVLEEMGRFGRILQPRVTVVTARIIAEEVGESPAVST